MQSDSESLGREKEWGSGTQIMCPYSLSYHYSKHIFIFETDMTPRTAFLGCYKPTQMHNICYLLPPPWLFCCWWKMCRQWGLPLSPRYCMQEKALITSVKLAGCLQSALARHSQNLKYFPWDVLVIIDSFLCWLLALYCLASNTRLQELLQPPDSAMDNLHLCTHICPEHRLSTTFCFSYAHAVVQVHPLSNLSMSAL